MKSKPLRFSVWLIVLALGGALLLDALSSVTPTLTFAGFRNDMYGSQVAVFRATNTSNRVYSYMGYGTAATPFYELRTPAATGGKLENPGFCGDGVAFHEVAPHSSVDFEIATNHSSGFALGVCFLPVSRGELHRRSSSRLWSFLRDWLPEPRPVWSALVP